jgi:hypothetical protein
MLGAVTSQVGSFGASLTVMLIGWLVTRRLRTSIQDSLNREPDETRHALEAVAFGVDEIESIVADWLDRTQAATLAVVPLFALMIDLPPAVRVLNAVTALLAVIALVLFMSRKGETSADARQGDSGISWPLLLVLVANVVGLATGIGIEIT